MEIEVGPTGNTVKGHVLDCDLKRLTRLVQEYDKQLYFKWNPKKNKGYGCWELRRRPNFKSAVRCGEFNQGKLFTLQYVENDIVHHVLDLPFLTYAVVDRLKEMDAWANKNLVSDFDAQQEQYLEKERKKIREERRHALREERKYVKEFVEHVKSGYNPLWFLSDHRKSIK